MTVYPLHLYYDDMHNLGMALALVGITLDGADLTFQPLGRRGKAGWKLKTTWAI